MENSYRLEALIIKLAYAVYCFSVGFYYIYVPVKYTALGFSAYQIGLLFMNFFLFSFLAQPLWGMLSDYWRTKKKVLIVACGLAATSVLGFSFFTEFGSLLVVSAFFGMTQGTIFPLLDALSMDFTARSGVTFASLRGFASGGYFLSGLVVGYIANALGIKGLFIGCAMGLFAVALLLIFLPEITYRQDDQKKFKLQDIGQFLRNKELLVFILFILICRFFMIIVFNFHNIQLLNLGASPVLIGFTSALAGLSEVVYFLFSTRQIKKFGLLRVAYMSMLFCSLRWMMVAMAPNPTIFIANSFLQGLTIGGLTASGVAYINHKTPTNLKATGQTIYGSVFYGIAPVLASVTGGYVIQLYGIVPTFWACGVLSLVAAVVFRLLIRNFSDFKQTVTEG